MCLPMAALSAVAGLAGTALQVGMQMNASKKQEQANNDWANYQRQQRLQESSRQDAARMQADAARVEGLKEVAPEAMVQTQANEATRLNQELQQPVDNINVSDALLSGQQRGSQVFNDALGAKLADATSKARDRIKALASLQAFGGSSGGLEMATQNALQKTGNKIDLANNIRSGSLSAYGSAKAVNPVQYFGAGQGASMIGGLSNALVGYAGQKAGTSGGFFG